MTVQNSVSRKKCFVISPIGEKGSPERDSADKVLKHLIRKSLSSDFDISRADEDLNPGAISPTMMASILEADLVIADLSGLNPNVFYELAIAHGYNKPTVHLQRSGEAIPFDIKDMRIVRYNVYDPEELEDNQKLLREYANFAVNSPEKMENPLTSAQKFIIVEGSTDPVAESNVRVMQAIKELSVDVKKAVAGRVVRPVAADVALNHQRASSDALRKIVERVVNGNRAEEADFESIITLRTPTNFDDWAKTLYMSAFPGEDDEDVNLILYDAEMMANENADDDDDDYEPDEDELRGR